MVISFLGEVLLQIRGVLGNAGWRWMFLLEDLTTLLGVSPGAGLQEWHRLAVTSFFLMAQAPSKAETRFRPNGHVTDREAKIIVN